MPRLKDREKQIPGGLRFYEPALKWKPPPYASFNTIVTSLIQARRANPYLVQRNSWAIDYATVANEVDTYNAAICKSHRWDQYILEDEGPPPKVLPRPSMANSLSQGVQSAAVGAKTLKEWIGSGGVPVKADVSQARAHVCATCPQNKRDSHWTTWFTAPAANGIRQMLALKDRMSLSTPEDDMLNVCDACGCPLKLKVHTPIEHIAKHMPPYQRELLDPRCWVLSETT